MFQIKKSGRDGVVFLIASALLSLRFIFRPGLYYAHDSIYHFVRQFHFWHELTRAQFPVRMATDLAYGFGYPLFNFVYSLPYLIGSAGVMLGAGYGNSLKALVVLFSIASVVLWYVWLKRYFSDQAALLGALVFWFFPYRFLTIFVTFQLGAIVAGGFFPLLLLGLDSLLAPSDRDNKKKMVALFLAVMGLVGLVLSHLISLIIYLPFLLTFGIWKILSLNAGQISGEKMWRPAQMLGLTLLFSIGLTAFYWLPATLELDLVKAGQQDIVQYSAHFPTLSQLTLASWGYGYSVPGEGDGISFQIGYAQWLAFGAAIALVILALLKKRARLALASDLGLLLVGVISFIGYLWLMLPASNLIWQLAPLLKSVQHPWRLLSGIGASASLIASVLANTKWGKLPAVLLVLIAVINTRNYQRPMTLDYRSDEELSAKGENLQSGDVSWEFLPVWANPPDTFPQNSVRQWSGQIESQPKNNSQIILTNDQTQELVLNKIFYPSWRVFDNGRPIDTHVSAEGMLAVSLTPGTHQISLQLGQTWAATWGNLISLVTLGGWLAMIIGSLTAYAKTTKKP